MDDNIYLLFDNKILQDKIYINKYNNINNLIINTLREKENIFKQNGYIKEQSSIINYRSIGKFNHLLSNSGLEININYNCDIFNPAKDNIYIGIVKNNNVVGLQVELYYYNYDTKYIIMNVYILKQLNKDIDFDKIKIGNTIYIKIIGIKYIYNSKLIKGIGEIVLDEDIKKMKKMKDTLKYIIDKINIPLDMYANILYYNHLKIIFKEEEYLKFDLNIKYKYLFIYKYLCNNYNDINFEDKDYIIVLLEEYINDIINKQEEELTYNMLSNNICLETGDDITSEKDDNLNEEKIPIDILTNDSEIEESNIEFDDNDNDLEDDNEIENEPNVSETHENNEIDILKKL